MSMSTSTVTRDTNEEKDDDSRVRCVICCNCILFIIMIILLLLVLTNYSCAFTLICAFEYLPHPLNKDTPQCTDFVYIRFFVYSYQTNMEPIVFEEKKRFDGVAKLYYDDTALVWRRFSSYRALDNNVRNSKRHFPYSRWFVGMWGTTFTRLV
ncbi:uncharacterized protein LOC142767180 [Rhipicephalus microplus]|uniref:uncharacterized protein LOC142767180 n=1 Tax=Rhipicephalus microplus TaxID=6941 RepID=UPI003F6B83DF